LEDIAFVEEEHKVDLGQQLVLAKSLPQQHRILLNVGFSTKPTKFDLDRRSIRDGSLGSLPSGLGQTPKWALEK
jgi:hypothetical protein